MPSDKFTFPRPTLTGFLSVPITIASLHISSIALSTSGKRANPRYCATSAFSSRTAPVKSTYVPRIPPVSNWYDPSYSSGVIADLASTPGSCGAIPDVSLVDLPILKPSKLIAIFSPYYN